jgi:hypothetical protein
MDRVLLALKWLYETSKCCCGGRWSGPDNTDTKLGALNLFVASFSTSFFLILYFFPLSFQEKSTAPDNTDIDKTWCYLKLSLLSRPLTFISEWISWSGQYGHRQNMALSEIVCPYFLAHSLIFISEGISWSGQHGALWNCLSFHGYDVSCRSSLLALKSNVSYVGLDPRASEYVGFEVLTAAVMNSSVFWDTTPCSPLKINRRFRGTRLPYHQVEDKAK